MNNYKDLQVWKKAFDLSANVYQITKELPKEEIFGMTSQMRRCAVSIVSNIAEGHGRGSNKDFSRFLKISIGSCNELETQVLLSEKLNYIKQPESLELQEECKEIMKMLNGLIKKL
jgi:four helix bundle protein